LVKKATSNNNKNNNNYKYPFIFICVLIYLIIILLIKQSKIHLRNSYITKKKENIISYKGSKVIKSKLINDYLSKIPDKYIVDKEKERNRFNMFYNLEYYSDNLLIQSKLKDELLKEISKLKNQTVTKLETFYLSTNKNFGNGLIIFNNAIFFCEVVGCHRIILNENNIARKWLIKNPIYIKKLNITIFQGPEVDCNLNNILCIHETAMKIFFPYFPIIISPQVRTDLIKSEILKNLPLVNTNKNDLYIHIRGGDIFQTYPHRAYAQPPLCFYDKIIKNQTFSNIYIISMDRLNIIVNTLMKKYKNIVHNINDVEKDISLLTHAYKIAASVSSFIISAIKLNDNLKDLWEYDIMRLSEKFVVLHHHIAKFKIKYRIHSMTPSNNYLSQMFSWKSTPEQIKLMLEDQCPFDFVLIKTNK